MAAKQPQNFGERVKALREKAKISQQQLAQTAGVSMSFIAKIEQGSQANPRAKALLALARALGVKMDDLFQED